jgi:hypothetical protein
MKLAGEVHPFQSEQLALLESIYITMVPVEAKRGVPAARWLSVEGTI